MYCTEDLFVLRDQVFKWKIVLFVT